MRNSVISIAIFLTALLVLVAAAPTGNGLPTNEIEARSKKHSDLKDKDQPKKGKGHTKSLAQNSST